MQKRLPIPNQVKLQLRKEPGFGCCKCGKPIIEYHHIVPYTEFDPHFRIDDMMCLCPYCHHEATLGALTIEEQRELKIKPFNIINNRANGLLKINQKILVVEMGSVQFINDVALIKVDNNNLIEIAQSDKGRIELTLKLYDEKNNLLIFIEKNEWKSGDFFPWDIESSFQWIRIRQKKGKINLSVDAREFPISIMGNLLFNKQEIDLKKGKLVFKNNSNSFSSLCFVGGTINIDSKNKKLEISPHPFYGKSIIVSDDSPLRRIEKGLDAFYNLKLLYFKTNFSDN